MTSETGRVSGFALAAAIVAAVASSPAAAQYRYGGGGGDESGKGFFFELEGMMANVRNADNVVATIDSGNVVSYILPEWDDDLGGRVAAGYRWGGDKLFLRAWGFATEQDAAEAGALNFTIGPPVGGDVSGTALDITTEVTMNTVDVGWAKSHGVADALDLEWSVALRYARFEETADGVYADGAERFSVAKSNEGEMVGVHAGVRGTYLRKFLVFSGRLGFSFLDGELTATSGLTQTAGGSGASSVSFSDDGRSGGIRELDVTGGWHNASNTLQVYLGWEQDAWEEIAADMVRGSSSLPTSPLRDRDSVTVSGWKLGLRFRR
jgi:hypothetical protein